jgi:hypothetical protein
MITYKYHFDAYSCDVDVTVSYKSRKIELEIILYNLIIFMAYLFIITGIFLYQNRKNNRKFDLIIVFVSILLFVFCSLELCNYVGEYKCIKTNFNHSELAYSYKFLKTENTMIMGYLKVFIPYLFMVISYFGYQFFRKKT